MILVPIPLDNALFAIIIMIMRFAALILLWWSAALARAQYSAVETDVVDPTEVVAPSSTTQSIPGTTPSITAAVLFPSASSAWSHNGTAYLKYSLPDGVSPKSVSYVLANDNAGLIKAGNSKIEELKSYFVYQTMMRESQERSGEEWRGVEADISRLVSAHPLWERERERDVDSRINGTAGRGRVVLDQVDPGVWQEPRRRAAGHRVQDWRGVPSR